MTFVLTRTFAFFSCGETVCSDRRDGCESAEKAQERTSRLYTAAPKVVVAFSNAINGHTRAIRPMRTKRALCQICGDSFKASRGLTAGGEKNIHQGRVKAAR